MSRPAPKITVSDTIAVFPDRRKAYVVRWRFNGVGHWEGYEHRAQADRFRSRLLIAVQDEDRWDARTGKPSSWTVTGDVSMAEWTRTYLASRWAERAPHTRASMVQSLVLGIVRSGTAKAPELTLEQRLAVKAWLAPVWDATAGAWVAAPPLPKDVAKWIATHSPRLSELDRAALYKLDASLRVREDGSGQLSAATAARHTKAVKACLDEAVAAGVMDACEWPTGSRGGVRLRSKRKKAAAGTVRHEDVPSAAQLRAVIEAMGGTRSSANFRALTAVCGYAGLRPSEALALSPRDMHLPETGWGTMDVLNTMASAGVDPAMVAPGEEEAAPKTWKRPGLPISPLLVAELRSYLTSTGLTGDAGMFRTSTGTLPTLANWSRAITKACKAVGVKPFTPYGLRHMAASHMAAAGVEPAVNAWRLGHSVMTAMAYYHHVVEGSQERANRLLDELYGTPELGVGEGEEA